MISYVGRTMRSVAGNVSDFVRGHAFASIGGVGLVFATGGAAMATYIAYEMEKPSR